MKDKVFSLSTFFKLINYDLQDASSATKTATFSLIENSFKNPAQKPNEIAPNQTKSNQKYQKPKRIHGSWVTSLTQRFHIETHKKFDCKSSTKVQANV